MSERREKLPDHISDSILNQMAILKRAAWADVFEKVLADLRANHFQYVSAEILRLRAYEKLCNLVNLGYIEKQGREYVMVSSPPQPEAQGESEVPKEDLRDIALRVLNEAYQSDPVAMQALFHARVPCNHALAVHPTIQVSDQWMGSFDVGVIGLLNGIIEAATGKRIATVFDDDGEGKLTGFAPYTPTK